MNRIAVTFHIFYDDFVDVFAADLQQAMAELQAVDVFVTTPEVSIAHRAVDAFSQIEGVGTVRAQVLPNRGRNFGALLIAFSEDLLRYDIVGHFHSKKSLYTGRRQVEWADHIFETLLRAPESLRRIIAELSARASSYGVAYPSVPDGFPFWVSHWLKNVGAANRIGVSQVENGYLSYPVGGMLWFRPCAVAQLLERSWTWDDFDVESGQIDGTTAHAVERLFAAVSRENGYRPLVIDAHGALLDPESEILARCQKSLRRGRFRRAVVNADGVVSFDVFDTLVQRRDVWSEGAKYDVGEHLVHIGLEVDPEHFVNSRDAHELALRQRCGEGEDVSIHQVYEALQSEYPELPAYLPALEFQSDIARMEPRDSILSVVHERAASGRPIAIVSDTYYTREQLSELMRVLEVKVPLDMVYASSTCGRRKDRGDMWPFLIDKFRAIGGAALHVGDNVVSDGQNPGDFAIPTFVVPSAPDIWAIVNSGSCRLDYSADGVAPWTRRLVALTGKCPFIGGDGT
jgi:FMN phosphatase YigB (HAD superfamily)